MSARRHEKGGGQTGPGTAEHREKRLASSEGAKALGHVCQVRQRTSGARVVEFCFLEERENGGTRKQPAAGISFIISEYLKRGK